MTIFDTFILKTIIIMTITMKLKEQYVNFSESMVFVV